MRNIILKGIKVEKDGSEDKKEGVKRLSKEIGVIGKVEEVRGLGEKNIR